MTGGAASAVATGGDPESVKMRLRALMVAAFAVGIGDLLVAFANVRGRDGLSGVRLLYDVGVLLLYLGPAFGALRLRRDRSATVILTGMLALGLFLVRVSSTPTRLATTDELQTLRSLNDLHRSHHLFAVNPIVGTYGRFPGSQVAVVALHDLSGMSMSTAGKVLLGGEHLLLCIALFILAERLIGHSFVAFLAVIVYACNPSYVFYDSETSYEAFAIPLAVVVLTLLVVAAGSELINRRRLIAVATVVGIVVCVSHHMTSYWLAAMLVGWTLFAFFVRRRQHPQEFVPWLTTAVVTAFAALWYAFMARAQLTHELGPTVTDSISSIRSALSGSSPLKAPFSSTVPSEVFTDPFGLRLLGFASVGLGLSLLVGGLWQLRRRKQLPSLVVTMLGLGLLYPVGVALRVTQASTETGSRSSEFVFFGLAFCAALLAQVVLSPWPLEVARGTRRKYRASVVALAYGAFGTGVGVLAIGGVVLGTAPYDRTAGPYVVGADTRSVGLLGEETAKWAAANLPAGSNFFSDLTNANLIDSAGDFTRQDGVINGRSVKYLFTGPTFNAVCRDIIQGDKIRYLVIDQRLSTAVSGATYHVRIRKHGTTIASKTVNQLPSANLSKFAHAPGLNRIYDNGTIRIYEVASSPNTGEKT